MAVFAPVLRGQNPDYQDSAILEGTVCDAQNQPLANATVSLELRNPPRKLVSRTDSRGHYRFEALPAGTYTLRAQAANGQETNEQPIGLQPHETRSIVLRLSPESGKDKNPPGALEFSDEPTFTVAGVTDPSNLGGHGSDVVLRTKEALAKDTASLMEHAEGAPASANALNGFADTAGLHERRGDIAESEGRPLEAVREYQRAAEMDPSEPNLFAWGAELLLHRAFDPAIEVFAKGHGLYPRSVRTLLGLAVASYSRGLNDQANRLFLQACDLDPRDPTPYLFLGRLLESEKTEPQGWTEKLKRFVKLHPGNALAHYYYALSLTKQGQPPFGSAVIEAELKKAIELDPHLGSAYLQLGILYSAQKQFSQAVAALQKAIELTPFPDEAHYRLAQVYRQTGEVGKARVETEIFNRISQQKNDAAERDRHGIQQFVYTLKDQIAPAPTPASNPR